MHYKIYIELYLIEIYQEIESGDRNIYNDLNLN